MLSYIKTKIYINIHKLHKKYIEMSFTSPNPEYSSIMRSKFTNKEMLIEGTSVINQKYFLNKIGEF